MNIPHSKRAVRAGSELTLYYKECEENPDISVEERMKYEIIRFSSFSSCSNLPVTAMKLSKAGFFLDLKSESILCYKCGFTFTEINTVDEPMEIHQKQSPTCDFVISKQGKTNSKKTEKSAHKKELGDISNSNAGISSEQTGACGGPGDVKVNKRQNAETVISQETSRSHICLNTARTSNDSESRTQTRNMFTSENHGNFTATLTASTKDGQKFNPIKPKQKNQDRNLKDTFTSLGICIEKPQFPQYAILATRISSYKKWPASTVQFPNNLAKAGFFYEGVEDNVRCFYCGGRLGEWEMTDDPWKEHERWFPNCQFVKQCKGNITETTKANGEQSLSESQCRNDYMASPASQSLVEMGYSKELVQMAYTQLKKTTGQVRPTAEVLLHFIMESEESEVSENEKQTRSEETESTNLDSKNDIKSLIEENEELRGQKICKICMDEDASVVFLPCGHMSTCTDCAPAMRKCPICRSFIKGTVKAILS